MDSRKAIAKALTLARHSQPLHAAGRSGVGYRVIDRLERAQNVTVDLSPVYLLAQHYDVALDLLLRFAAPATTRAALGHWHPSTPSLPDLDAQIRRALRSARLARRAAHNGLDWGTPRLAREAGVEQSWVVRFEGGSVSRCDLVRVERCAQALGTTLVRLLPGEMWSVDHGRPDDAPESPG